MLDFAARLAWLRSEANLSQQELGRLAGVSAAAIGHWERGLRANPESTAAVAIARVTGCSLDWLLREVGERPTTEQIAAAVAEARKASPLADEKKTGPEAA